jgi:hypothetical protein
LPRQRIHRRRIGLRKRQLMRGALALCGGLHAAAQPLVGL